MKSVNWVDPVNPVMTEIIEMIRNEFRPVMEMKRSVEIVEDEKSWEPEICPPKRIRDPRVQIIVIRRRSIISDYRRTLIVIIVVYCRGLRILRTWVDFMRFTR